MGFELKISHLSPHACYHPPTAHIWFEWKCFIFELILETSLGSVGYHLKYLWSRLVLPTSTNIASYYWLLTPTEMLLVPIMLIPYFLLYILQKMPMVKICFYPIHYYIPIPSFLFRSSLNPIHYIHLLGLPLFGSARCPIHTVRSPLSVFYLLFPFSNQNRAQICWELLIHSISSFRFLIKIEATRDKNNDVKWWRLAIKKTRTAGIGWATT